MSCQQSFKILNLYLILQLFWHYAIANVYLVYNRRDNEIVTKNDIACMNLERDNMFDYFGSIRNLHANLNGDMFGLIEIPQKILPISIV